MGIGSCIIWPLDMQFYPKVPKAAIESNSKHVRNILFQDNQLETLVESLVIPFSECPEPYKTNILKILSDK